MHELLLEHQPCVLLAEELIGSHINSFLPVAKLALPSASLHTKASFLISQAPQGAATASKRREGTLHPDPVTGQHRATRRKGLSPCTHTHTALFLPTSHLCLLLHYLKPLPTFHPTHRPNAKDPGEPSTKYAHQSHVPK